MRYKALFIDIDDTLLDYVPCCREAFDAALASLSAEWAISSDELNVNELFSLFFNIAGRLFSEAKHGLHTIAEVMDLYPAEFMETSGLMAPKCSEAEKNAMIETFKHAFRAAWGETHSLVPGTIETLQGLKKKGYRLYAASNSFGALQRRRMERAGLLPLFDDLFISMDIGYDKPDIRFFEHALKSINNNPHEKQKSYMPIHPHEVLMVGDSMTTDILGAKAAGWKTCFFNRRPAENPSLEVADYTIHSLTELLEIC